MSQSHDRPGYQHDRITGERVPGERSGSLPDLLSDVLTQVTNLMRTEIRLARTEMSEKMSEAGAAAGMIGVGGVLLLGALLLVLQGLVMVLVAFNIQPMVATFIVAVVVALVGYLVLRKGMADLSASNVVPNRTVNSLEKDAAVAKEQVR